MSKHSFILRKLLVVLLSFFTSGKAIGQTRIVPSRVVEQIDETKTVHIHGNVHPLARAEFDRGAVAESQPMTRMLLLLQRSAEQETALRQLLDAQQTKGSGSYHAWLTPTQFGKQFGPSDADVQAVTGWLTKQGFQVAKVSEGRTTVEFRQPAVFEDAEALGAKLDFLKERIGIEVGFGHSQGLIC